MIDKLLMRNIGDTCKAYRFRLVFIALLLSCMQMVKAQDPQFSQFYSNYLYLAPSFAGLNYENRLALNYRNQWPEITNGFVTYSVSFEHFFSKFNSGLGFLMLRDEAGTGKLRSTNVGLQYSFDFKITELIHCRPGMHFMYTERGLDFNQLLFKDQMSASGNSPVSAEVVAMDNVGDIDFATSILTYSPYFWVGFSADHLLRPNQSLYDFEDEDGNLAKVPIKYQVFGGTKYVAKQRLLRPVPTSLQLAFLFRSQNEFRQLDAGVYWFRAPLVFGLWYRGIPVARSFRYNDALTLLVGIKTQSFNLGYSYDFTTSKLITNTNGAHEISLSYTFNTREIKRRPKMVPCPEF